MNTQNQFNLIHPSIDYTIHGLTFIIDEMTHSTNSIKNTDTSSKHTHKPTFLRISTRKNYSNFPNQQTASSTDHNLTTSNIQPTFSKVHTFPMTHTHTEHTCNGCI